MSYFHDYPDSIEDCIKETFPNDVEMHQIARDYIQAAVILRKIMGELAEFIFDEVEQNDDDDYYYYDDDDYYNDEDNVDNEDKK